MEINLNKFKIADCIHGIMTYPINDTVIGLCLKHYGEWAEGENVLMSKFISEGDIVLDIGANIGTTTLSLSKNVSDSGKVIAFEPQDIVSQCLQTNLTLNDITNVSVFNTAVSNQNGWAKINDKEFSESGRYGEAGISETGTRVKTLKLDELELNDCSLIKIDIEGHEWEAIQGGKNLLKKFKPVLYMEAKKEIKGTQKCLEWLMTNGWECYWHFAFWYRKNNFKKNNNTDILQSVGIGIGDMNFLAVPKEREQPKNLPKILKHDEEWTEENYRSFFEENNFKSI